ncbi:MAG TPA: bifunctional riboflavin kinase/FAD synthetase [Clostridia bacterium]
MTIKKFGEKLNNEIAIALGFFDSVHLGHRAVINKAVEYAKVNNIKSAVITYSNNPFLTLGIRQKLIYAFEERLEKFEKLGVDFVIAQEFDYEFMQKDKNFFVDELLSCYDIKYAVCGQDYRFGKNGSGDVDFLKELFNKLKIDFEVLDFVKDNNLKISSSDIRKLIENGEINKANKLLGEPFFITGIVNNGKGYGRALGFPTANIKPQSDKVKPRQGVYITKTFIDQNSYISITHIGGRPTFRESEENIETHILDYDGDLYNRKIKIEFYDYVRPIFSFENKSKLISQIMRDVQTAKEYFRGDNI